MLQKLYTVTIGLTVILLSVVSPAGSEDTKDDSRSSIPFSVRDWINDPCDLSAGNCVDAPMTLTEGYTYAWKQFLALTTKNGRQFRLTQFGNAQDLFPEQGVPGAYPGTAGMQAGQTGKHIALNDVRQAAAIVPVIDRNGRWLQYSVLTNKPEWDYIKDHALYDPAAYNALGCSNAASREDCLAGKACVTQDGSDGCAKGRLRITLPDDAIELKVAWRVLETCDLPDSPAPCEPESTDGYVTVKTSVNPYGAGKLYGEVRDVTLGLVGVHILSKTAKQPDWVWTTFEYRYNAPGCTWTFRGPHWNMFCPPLPVPLSAWAGQTENPNHPHDRTSNPYLPALAWELAQKGQVVLTEDDQRLVCTSRPDKFKFAQPPLFEPTTNELAKPTAVCRENAIHPDVVTYNDAIRRELAKLGPRYSYLMNYELVGVFWFKDDCRTDPNCDAIGSTDLSNTTMETFEQYLGPLLAGRRDRGCTVCHGINQFNPMPYSISPVAEGLADRSFIFQRIHPDWVP